MHACRFSLLLIVLCACEGAARAALPLEDFFRDHDWYDVAISPDGTQIAALRGTARTRNLFLQARDGGAARQITRREAPEAVLWAAWTGERRLVYRALDVDRRGIRVANFYSVDLDGDEALRIGGEGYFDDRRRHGEIRRQTHYFRYLDEDIVDWLPADPDHLLLASDRRSANFPHVYRVDLSDGKRRRVLRAPGRRAGYIADQTGRIRVAWTTETDLTHRLLYRHDERSRWSELGQFRFDGPNLLPLGFTPGDRLLYVLSDVDHDKRALYTYDPQTREHVELIFSHPDVDINDAVFSKDRRSLVAVEYVTDRYNTHYFDADIAAAAAALQQRWPQRRVHYVDASLDHRQIVFLVEGNRTPGSYFLVEAGSALPRELGAVAPWIDPQRIAWTQPVQFAARDGLRLDAYLTLPLGPAPTQLPLIVIPHGGPYQIRDTADFDAQVKFLADRGYAVLQINFRGSGGYGRDFAAAGHREWGRRMQDDVTDGVRWALEQGIADPGRICIYGSSYGGYAALMGLVLTPELYRCGISVAGVSDLSLLFEYQLVGGMRVGDPDEQRFWEIVVGDPRDRERLRELSPVHRVESIAAPVLIAHGGRDYVAHVEHAKRLREAMDRAGKPYEWLLAPDEGHGFHSEAGRIELYTRIEQFLARHLAAD